MRVTQPGTLTYRDGDLYMDNWRFDPEGARFRNDIEMGNACVRCALEYLASICQLAPDEPGYPEPPVTIEVARIAADVIRAAARKDSEPWWRRYWRTSK